MPAGKYDITIEQGATFSLTIDYEEPEGTPFDLSTYSIAAKVRSLPSSSSPLLTLAVSALTLSAGSFQLYAAASATAALVVADPPSRTIGYWDLEFTAAGASATAVVTRILEGRVFISPESTR